MQVHFLVSSFVHAPSICGNTLFVPYIRGCSGVFLIYSVFRFTEYNYWSANQLLILTSPPVNAAVSVRNYGSTVHFRHEHQLYEPWIYTRRRIFHPICFTDRGCKGMLMVVRYLESEYTVVTFP